MKKFVLLLMVIALSVSLLAGCANQGADDVGAAQPDSFIESAPTDTDTDTDPENIPQKPQNDTQKDDGGDDKEEVPDEKNEDDTNQPENDKESTPTDPGSDTENDPEPQEPQDDAETDDGEEEKENILDGKKIIFMGNSHTYYGRTVLGKSVTMLTQAQRMDDKGYFYQLCKANGAEVEVTNWTFGGHYLTSMFNPCNSNKGCDGENHESYLLDRNYDYVVMQDGNRSDLPNFVATIDQIMSFFKVSNPDTKFVYLAQHTTHMDDCNWRYYLKDLEKKGVIIVDWGAVVVDIMNGKVKVPGATQVYNKNSFVIGDGFHPSVLSGYITTLMTYCAITGESAVGQDYSFCNNTSINKDFSFTEFVENYYTKKNATTNFPEIFASEKDMKGIQTLVDQYLEEKAYRNY